MNTHNHSEIKELLVHEDNLLHTRVNSWILAETIFFIVVGTIWKEQTSMVIIICFLGILTTLLFGFTIIKLHLRVEWLINKYKVSNPLFQEYLKLEGFDLSNQNGFTKWIYKIAIKNPPKILSTGFLYSVGLNCLFTFGWILILIVKINFHHLAILICGCE